jgi:RNA polymerase sigma-70 factor (ECF subfamily)
MADASSHPTPSPEQASISTSLLVRVQARDDDAWRQVCRLYAPVVETWGRQRGVPQHDLGDVRQDVFLAAAAGIADFQRQREGQTFRGWLYGITHFKVLDYWRRRAKQPHAAGGSDAQQMLRELPEEISAEASGDALAADRSGVYRRALELVRGEFTDQSWQAFWKTAIEEQSAAEVGAELGMKPGAVYVAKSRVLKRLRETLSGLEDFDDEAGLP